MFVSVTNIYQSSDYHKFSPKYFKRNMLFLVFTRVSEGNKKAPAKRVTGAS
jgi:hypothetical protein